MMSLRLTARASVLYAVILATAVAQDKPSATDSDLEIYAKLDRIFEEVDEKVSGNLTAFNAANETPLKEARHKIAEIIAQLNKEGRTALATSVQKRLNGLADTVAVRVRAKVPIVADASGKTLLRRLEGKWDITNEPRHYRLHAHGVAECIQDADGRVLSSGRITVVTPHLAEIVWESGWKNHFRISGDDAAISVFSWDPNGRRDGTGFALERIR